MEEIYEAAKICPHCKTLLREYKVCPRCSERVLFEALVCRYCGFDFERYEQRERIRIGVEKPDETTVGYSANPLGALFADGSITGLLFPPELIITSREVVINKKTFLGLRTTSQKIPIMKIASVRFVKGIIWGGIIFESYGGGIPDLIINGLEKDEAIEIAAYLESILAKFSLDSKK